MKTQLLMTSAPLFACLTATLPAAAADLRVPADHATIQAAVNAAADGDTIHIAPGVYAGPVEILSKKLALIGQLGTVLRATADLPVASGPAEISHAILYVRLSEVTLRGLTFEGERLAGRYVGPEDLRGVLIRSSTATVEDCSFFGFRESTPDNEDSFALSVSAGTDRDGNLRVSHCTFADNQLAIFLVAHPERRGLNITIENNTIVGPGPTAKGLPPAGIVVRQGVGGRIVGNTISNFSYTGSEQPFPFSFGIEASNQAVDGEFGTLEALEIEGNMLRNNQIHLSLVKGDHSVVRNNRIEGTAPGSLQLGFALSGKSCTVADNFFSNIPEAIRLFGDDPAFGELVGIASNASLLNNRFCNVTRPINKQRLATATETGSALNVCTPPILSIRPASLISWPVEENGWTVEFSPSLEGPWSVSNATPFTQDGQHNIAVPNVRTSRYYRLR